jgi:putative ABC transport system substrate-binding protein
MRLKSLLACLVGLVTSVAADASFAATKKIMVVTFLGCDATCVGFKDGIAKSGIDAEIIFRDAGQKTEALPGFVAEARALHVDMVNTIGTSATLGMIGTLSDVGSGKYLDDIPVVFTLVADPLGAKIIKSYESTGRANVTGTYNRVPEAVDLKAMRLIVPNLKKLGLLYDRHERNSMLKLADMQQQAPKLGFELLGLELGPNENAAPDPAKIPGLVAELAAKGVDFIYVGSSAFLRVNADVLTEAAIEHRLPVLSPYESMVRESHALLSIAAREEDVGRLGAKQALAILVDGKKPGDLPVAFIKDFAYVVNMKTAKAIDRFPPVGIMQIAETVN